MRPVPTSSARVKKTDRIILCGPMGAGKSSVGLQLATRTGHAFVDIDERVAARFGAPVSDLFATLGEPAFRVAEADAVAEALEARIPVVVALGGGALETDRSWSRCTAPDVTLVWLQASAATSLARLKGQLESRPLLQTADPLARLEELLQRRSPRWSCAQLAVDTAGRGLDEIVEEIQESLRV